MVIENAACRLVTVELDQLAIGSLKRRWLSRRLRKLTANRRRFRLFGRERA